MVSRKSLSSMFSLLAWSVLAAICTVYGLYALFTAFGLAETEKVRAFPLAFIMHALAGGIVLISGSLQFNSKVRRRFATLHRFCGRAYVITICIASPAGLLNAIYFDVGLSAKFSFIFLAVVWFATTFLGYQSIRSGRVRQHREWMTRSFSLSFFFVTFSIWVPLLSSSSLSGHISYPLAVTISWTLNLAIAETLIRLRRHAVDRLETAPATRPKNA